MKFKGKNDLKELSEFHLENKRSSYYPIILDRDPQFAAEFLTIEDSEWCLKLLQETLKTLEEPVENPNPLQYTLTFSQYNYNWFCQFINRLEELVLGEKSYVGKLGNLPEGKGTLQIYPPFHYNNKKHVLDKFRVKTNNPIDLYRINYIKRCLELTDFREGFPAWYMMSSSTVYEVYNEVTNVRVRIDFRNGEFMYFISGASDNWKQIADVPLEMDHVVSALLFRN